MLRVGYFESVLDQERHAKVEGMHLCCTQRTYLKATLVNPCVSFSLRLLRGYFY